MAIEAISKNLAGTAAMQPMRSTPFESQQAFGNVLKTAINAVNDSQQASDAATNKLIRGENIDLHEVMITAQKASITLNTTMEIRNKVIEAYQEVMRMPV